MKHKRKFSLANRPDWFMKRVIRRRNDWTHTPAWRKAQIFGALLKAQDGLCALCDELLPPALGNIDHLQPIGRGGTNHRSNLAATHIACNTAKANMTLAEWRARIRS